MKKIFITIIAFLLPLMASASYNYDAYINGIYYNFSESTKTATVTFSAVLEYEGGVSYSGSVSIPSKVTYKGVTYTVTAIGGGTFDRCNITSVTIPNSVTSIEGSAFYGCSSLTSIVIPSNVRSIGRHAFYGCSGLTSITIPSSVTSIDDYAFNNCSGLTTIVSEIENPFDISDNVFSNYTVKLLVPAGKKSAYQSKAGWKKFQNIVELEKKTLHVSTAGTLPNLLQDYEKRLIEELTLTGNLNGTDIACIRRMAGAALNYDWDNVKEVVAEKEINPIYGKLHILDISNATIVSGGGAYMQLWHKPSTSPYYDDLENTIYTSNNTISECMFDDCKFTKVYLPSNITSIGSWAFCGCSSLPSITIPNSVTSIGYGAFWACSGLISVMIPNSVTSIGGSAFMYCSGLNSITIPNSVTSIGDYAFYGCSGLTSIVSKIKKPFAINNSVFNSNIYATAKLIVPYGTKSLYQSKAGWDQFQNIVEADPVGERVICEKDFTGITEFTGWSQFDESQTDGKVGVDPNGVAITVGVQTGQLWQPQVMVIPDGSFNLEEDGYYRVVITAKFPTDGTLMVNMGSWSANDQSLFPVKSTGDFQEIVCDFEEWICNAVDAHLLLQCGDFKGTTIVKKIKIIDMGDTVIPFSVDNIYYKLFTEEKTAKVTINPTKYQGNVTIPSTIIYKGEEYAVTAIDKVAFCNCNGLTSITIPNSVTSIGKDAFSGCSNLQFACISSGKFPTSFSLGNNSCQYIMPQSAFDGGIPTDITNYATYGVTPMYIQVTSTTATSAILKMTPIDIVSGKTSGTTTNEVIMRDLTPSTAVKGSWIFETKDRGIVSIPTVKTKSLVMTVQPALEVDKNTARLMAKVLEPDDDKHYGFEWLRNDAPDNMTPKRVQIPLCDEMMIGTLSGLNPEVYYKYRPYYAADDGTTFVGEWEAFMTADAFVKLEPYVQTKEVRDVSDTSATVETVINSGSEETSESGVVCTPMMSSTRGETVSEDGVIKVIFSGNETSAKIEGLKPGTKYVCRSYVTTASGTYYGKEKTFKTPFTGDAYEDGKVDAADIVEVVNAKAGNPSASFNLTNADMDRNGTLTEADITAIVNIIMGKGNN